MPVVHRFDPPDRFVAGTVGPPGGRTFFLQARRGDQLLSVSLEKQQVQVLGERVGELLDDLLESGATNTVVPALTPTDLIDSAPLDQPIEEEFRAGTLTLSWDVSAERVVIEVFPLSEAVAMGEEPEEEPEPDEVFLVRLTAGQARAFSARAESVVSAGREPCQFCGGPIDPEGHLCPRANGFRRTAP